MMSTTMSPRRAGPTPELRTKGDVFRGLGAFVLLVVLLVLPPVALALAAGAPPVPESLPSFDAIRDLFTTRDDGTLLIGFLTWVGWIAWATFALSVIVEIPAAIRGRAAVRLPGLRLQQRTVAGLIGLIISAMAAGPVASAAVLTDDVVETAPPDTSAAASPSYLEIDAGSSEEDRTDDAQSATYVVRPGDTLWQIAERELGDGHRWPEIAKLNYGLPQPNDSRGLRDPNWIDPGWQLVIPFDTRPDGQAADAAGHVVVEGDTLWQIAAASLGPDATDAEIAAEWPKWYEHNRQVIGDDPDLIQPGMHLLAPGDRASASPPADEETATQPPDEDDAMTSPSPSSPSSASSESEPETEPEAEESIFEPIPDSLKGEEPAPPEPQPEPEAEPDEPAADESAPNTMVVADDGPSFPSIPIRTIGGIGSLLAAGLVAVLAVHRRRRRSKRVAGEHLAPDIDLSITERALWDVADEFGVEAVDLALRAIARLCTRDGTPLPTVRAARLTADQFELYLDEPAALPAPWTQADDDYVWAIEPGTPLESELSGADVRDTPAPYPGLVTIGHDSENGHILLDLEYVGLLAVTGSELRVRHVMTALAIELATSSWADDATVAVVGICSELASSLGTGRLRYFDTVDELLTILESHASNDRPVLDASGAPSAASARSAGSGEWYPEIALIASPLSEAQAARLRAVLDATPRLAVAAVVTGDSISTDWTIDLDPDDPELAVLEPLGLSIAPQQVNATDYRAVVDMLVDTHRPADPPPAEDNVEVADTSGTAYGGDDLVAVSDLSAADVEAPDLDPADGPVIRVLGPVTIDGARGTADASHVGQLTEIAAYIALHPGCSSDDLDQAIWPGEPLKGKTRAQACSRLRNWLGDDDSGARFFPQMADGGYRFADTVRTDWAEFQRLVGPGPLSSVPVERLSMALGLVRGQPFAGVSGRRPKYRWADRLRASMIETIADVACAVASSALETGSPHTAREAASAGLQAEPGMEQLWRLLITAEYDAGNLAGVQTAVDRLHELFDDLGIEPDPETVAVLDRVSPAISYRRAGVT